MNEMNVKYTQSITCLVLVTCTFGSPTWQKLQLIH